MEDKENVASRPDEWWKSAVVYQIYPRSFADSNGDGIGDIPGITSKLDYLANLGVDVLWLSPVYRSPQKDNGYDISDYQDIDPSFGTLEDLDRLLKEAHSRGMKLVMDLVVNHTSDQHPWFIEARDPASPKRDWYIWRAAKDGYTPGHPGAEPCIWEAFFAPSSWTFDPNSGQYYLSVFSPYQPDLNWENPEVREAVYKMMRWWVDFGVDGFRMDVINFISKPDSLTTGAPLPDEILRSELPNGPRVDEFLQEMNRAVGLTDKNLITVGEMAGATVEVARRATDAKRRELNMVFTFEHMEIDVISGGTKWDFEELSLAALKNNLAHWQDGLAEAGWNSLYWNNHDQPRVVSRFGDDSPEFRVASAKALATVLHLHKGTPYVYQGEELGMTNAPFTEIEDYEDIDSLNWFVLSKERGLDEETILHQLSVKSRDHARTPVQWDTSENAGFTSGTPWFAVNPNYAEINAEAAVADSDSVFHHYRRLIALRHSDETVREGHFELLLADHPQIWAFTRTLGERTLLVVANFSSEAVELPAEDLPSLVGSSLVFGSRSLDGVVVLEPWEAQVLELAR
ncbi:MAG: alpha-glucosidase [Ancrocorticia sp.]